MVYGKKRGVYRKRSTTRRTRSKSTKGLTKTEKTQVKTIAKKAINTLAETKYFNCQAYDQQEFNSAWQNGSVVSEISVLGFTVGRNKSSNNSGVADSYKYGTNLSGNKVDMRQLKMNQVYLFDTPDAQLRSNAIEGNTIRPSFNETQWLLDRFANNTTSDYTKGLPYKVRMVRARPRALKGSFQIVNPEEDLFLTSSNQEFGISSLLVQLPPSGNIMNSFEFHLAKTTAGNTKFWKIPPWSLTQT